MPIYDYECEQCGDSFTRILPISMCDTDQFCRNCNAIRPAHKIIVRGHGGVRGDECAWVRDVGKTLEDPNIQTISDLRRFLKENPNIKPCESHPALPSSIGDIDKGPDAAERKRVRSKKAHDYIRSKRAININS